MASRILIELAPESSSARETQIWLEKNLVCSARILNECEVIGNLADFTKAAQEAAKTIPAPIIKFEKSPAESELESAAMELSDALSEAIEALHWQHAFTGSKKLKKLVRRLKNAYQKYA